jgi:hypothetical protein
MNKEQTSQSTCLILLPVLLLVVLASGCVTPQQVVGGGLFIKLSPDPSTIFSSGVVRLNFDIDNKNPRAVTDITAHIFDTGILSGTECKQNIDMMRPDEFKTFVCVFRAPPKESILQNEASTSVNALVRYTTDLAVVQLVEMMTEDEYLTRKDSGRLQEKPASYSYKDKNVEILVEFSDKLPIIVRPLDQRDYYIYFTIKNIGNGLIQDIGSNDFLVLPVNRDAPNILECENTGQLHLEGKEFPRIACKLVMPGGVKVVENYGLLLMLKYKYEVRESAAVKVIR